MLVFLKSAVPTVFQSKITSVPPLANNQFEIKAQAGGTGTQWPMVIFVGNNTDQIKLNTDGSTTLGGTSNHVKVSATGDLTFVGTAGFYPRFLTQSAEPVAGTGATQIDTSEMIIWKDSDDSKVYHLFNDGGTVKKIELI